MEYLSPSYRSSGKDADLAWTKCPPESSKPWPQDYNLQTRQPGVTNVWMTPKGSSQGRGEILGRHSHRCLLNLPVICLETLKPLSFLPSSFFVSSAFLTSLSPGLTWLLSQLADPLAIASYKCILNRSLTSPT